MEPTNPSKLLNRSNWQQLHGLCWQRLVAMAGLGTMLILIAIEPAAAQPWADSGGESQLNEFATNFIPWVIRWLLVVGILVGAVAHIWAGMTSDETKSYNRKEWRNRAWLAVATVIPVLIIVNGIVVAFGGDPLDFFPFI